MPFVAVDEEAATNKKSQEVSFPERYSKSENGWDFDILCMRSPGMWGDLCKCVALRALIRSVATAYAL